MAKNKILTLLLGLILFSGYYLHDEGFFDPYLEKYYLGSEEQEKKVEPIIYEEFDGESFTIANWNLQVFGQSKAKNESLLNIYRDMIDDYDIIIIQEIRDIKETAFPKLADEIQGYDYIVSSRAGQTTSKEQYGILYKEEIELVSVLDYNDENLEFRDDFNRPPIAVSFSLKGYNFTIYTIHTDPDEVALEMDVLEEIILNNNEGNIIVIGDLNADGNYYKNDIETHFDSWFWAIEDQQDTTVSKNDNSYDRIILNSDMKEEYLTHGIYRDGIEKSISDHYLVWGEFKIK